MPPAEDRPYEVIDGTPKPRIANGYVLTEFARVRPATGERLEHGALCEDSSHPVVIWGRWRVVKGARKPTDTRYVCTVCRPKPVKPTNIRRTYEDRPAWPEPDIRWMGWGRVARIVGPTAPRVPPWYPGPEPTYPDAEVQEAVQYQAEHKRPFFPPGHPANARVIAYKQAHKEWERWSRQCEMWRGKLVALHMRADDTRNAEVPSGVRESAWGYEA
jgi:hypothetical protein